MPAEWQAEAGWVSMSADAPESRRHQTAVRRRTVRGYRGPRASQTVSNARPPPGPEMDMPPCGDASAIPPRAVVSRGRRALIASTSMRVVSTCPESIRSASTCFSKLRASPSTAARMETRRPSAQRSNVVRTTRVSPSGTTSGRCMTKSRMAMLPARSCSRAAWAMNST